MTLRVIYVVVERFEVQSCAMQMNLLTFLLLT